MQQGIRILSFVTVVAMSGGGWQETSAPITEASIRAHMEFLAGDALAGRGSGTRDEWIAASYVAAQFRAWGLEPLGDAGGFVQRVEIAGSRVTAPPTLTAGDRTLTHGRQMLISSLPGERVSGTLFKYQPDTAMPEGGVAALLPPDVRPNDVSGAAIVMLPATDQMQSQWDARAGRLPSLPSRLVGVETEPAARAVVVYLDEAWYQVMSTLDAGTEITITADTEPAEPRFTWNAIGRLEGSDERLSQDVIVLSAHLDHTGTREVEEGEDGINNGADDDASGTVAVMELARAMATGPRPARTIVFALFGSEERGGYGAGYFVDKPVVPLDHIVADLQFEMLGRPDELVPDHTLWLTGYERSNLGAELAAHGARLVADPHPDENFFNRSDNIRFARRGIVAHTVSSYGLHEDYHRPSDEVSTIDFAHMTDAIRSMLAPIQWLASSDFRPAWAPDGCPEPCRR